MEMVAAKEIPLQPVRPLRAVYVLAGFVGIFAVANSLSIQRAAVAEQVYAVMLGVAGVLAVPAMWPRRRSMPLQPILVLWVAYLVLQILQIPFLPSSQFVSALVDLSVGLTPLIFVLVLASRIERRTDLVGPLVVIYLASLGASITSFGLSTGGRFEAPPVLAIVGAWVFASIPISELPSKLRPWLPGLSSIAVLGLLPIILLSSQRTALAVWVASGIFTLLHPYFRRFTLRAIAVAVPTLIILVGAGAFDVANRAAETPGGRYSFSVQRVTGLFADRQDASLGTRFDEVADVRQTIRQEGSLLTALVGFGHGATYIPNSAYITSNVDRATGRVHNIHVTPVTLWFRYGAIGVALFVGVMYAAFKATLGRARDRARGLDLLIFFGLAMYCIDLMVRNSLVDPAFSFLLACAFATSRLGGDSRS